MNRRALDPAPGPRRRPRCRWGSRTVCGRGTWLPTVVALLATPVTAQEPPSLTQLDSQWRLAVSEYEVAQDAAAAQRRIWEAQLSAWDRIGRSGVDGGDAALLRLQEASTELQRLELRVQDLRAEAEEARRALLVALDQRRYALESQYASTTDPVVSGRIESLLRDVTNQYRTLENESLAPNPLEALFATSQTFDPRDGPSDLRFKAEILERRVQEADSAIVRLDERIERLRTLLRVEQMGSDFRANTDRYGDTDLPTGPPRPANVREEPIPPDSTALQEAVPLEEQVAAAQVMRGTLVEFRDELARRAEEFRERLRRITT